MLCTASGVGQTEFEQEMFSSSETKPMLKLNREVQRPVAHDYLFLKH